ncbi:hypothetical protein BKD09_16800 [Bradyrhizobium japonicum]|uniref:Periplasmic binding protein domain-containing protein n=1 Tax=Bradyrhizobium japonicum TaxID=375 RepID=A0A1L3F9J3_BRAJP|nr:ABC transporter substrate-binding protein [Bradyrhizobium japonicum]APG09986.1 hypothetical protein BKD09_16800 [Bradyrhizobium japonicum]
MKYFEKRSSRIAAAISSVVAAVGMVTTLTCVSATIAHCAEEVNLAPPGLLEAVGSDLTAANAYKKSPPWKIGFSLPGTSNTWLVQMTEEARLEAGVHPEIGEFLVTNSNYSAQKQVADIEDLLTKNVDAIILSPVSPPAVTPVIEKAAERGIPVIVFIGRADTDKYAVQLRGGGEPFGKFGGDFLVKQLKGRGVIWMFRGVPGIPEETDRYNGAMSALKGTDIKIGVEVWGEWNYAKSKQICENLALSGKPVDGIWFSGAEMTRACIDVFRDLKKPFVPMTGESNNGFLRAWKENGIQAIASVWPPAFGPAAVRTAVALLQGRQLHRNYFSAPAPITSATFDQWFQPDVGDAFWLGSTLPDEKLKEMFPRAK